MLGTGMRVGEICGLRWDDIDLENGMIDVNHTLVYYTHAENGTALLQAHWRNCVRRKRKYKGMFGVE